MDEDKLLVFLILTDIAFNNGKFTRTMFDAIVTVAENETKRIAGKSQKI